MGVVREWWKRVRMYCLMAESDVGQRVKKAWLAAWISWKREMSNVVPASNLSLDGRRSSGRFSRCGVARTEIRRVLIESEISVSCPGRLMGR